LNKKLESWRKFETAKGFVYALYEEKLCDGFQNTISVLSFLLKKVHLYICFAKKDRILVGKNDTAKIGGFEVAIE
jgi:hypothetical protein